MKLLKDLDGGVTITEAGLYDVCEWWIESYPEDIFVKEPKEVVEIRRLMKEILKKKQ